MVVQIGNTQGNHRISKRKIQQSARAILDALGYPDAELSILIVDDQQIAKLNHQYLNREGPTNVIAFSMRQGQFAEITPQLLGDVVISWDRAVSQGREYGHGTQRELERLLVHGLLHLFGYDHDTDLEDGDKMREMEDRYLGVHD